MEQKLTKVEAVEGLKKLFDYENNKENRNVMVSEKDGNTTFFVNKGYLERYDVIERLQDFFADKYIEDGQCRVDNITFIYTIFHIEDTATAHCRIDEGHHL